MSSSRYPVDGTGQDNLSQHVPQQSNRTSDSPFSCNICHRSYTRLDHLSRHFRSHTREKPFTCEVCSKSFARADLLKRHHQNHETTDQDGRKRQKVTQPTPARAAQACKSCAASKVRCEGDDPCKRCEQKQIQCRYARRPSTGAHEASTTQMNAMPMPVPSHQPPNSSMDLNQQTPINLSSGPPMASFASPYNDTVQPYHSTPAVFEPNSIPLPTAVGMEQPTMDFSQFPSSMPENASFDPYDTGLTNFLRDVMTSMTVSGDQISQPYMPQQPFYNNNTFDLLDFATADPFSLPMNDFNGTMSPVSQGMGTNMLRVDEQTVPATKSGETTPSRAGLRLGIKAFRESHWQYAPVQGNHMGEDQIDMFQPLEELLQKTKSPAQDRLCPALKQPTRDRILTTVIAQCDAILVRSVISSFPSAELLTNLVHHFLLRHRASEDTWIHIPSFNPNQQNPETMMSIIAAGAMYSELPEIRKLGFAFQEAARIAALKLFETDNRNTRFLKPMQSFMLMLDCGLWSGDRRKLELAESYALTIITMIRRGGFLRSTSVTAFLPESNDSPDDIEVKWYRWIEHESFKRLAFHLLIRDAQTSSSLVDPPLLSTAEMAVELPASRDLWQAKNSTEWRRIFMARFANLPGRIPTLRTLTEELTVMQDYIDVVDLGLVTRLLMSGLWAFTYHYRELVRLDSNHTPRNAALITTSLYQETVQALEHCKLTCTDWNDGISPLATLLHERILLSMHVSLEDVQLLAGKAGEEEARRVYPLLTRWAESRESRQALWHSGQIFRAAKQYPARQLRDFSAVALYHASLVFWAYYIVAGSTESSTSTAADRRASQAHPSPASDISVGSSPIHLDSDQSDHLHRFVVLGRGVPVVTAANTSPPEASNQDLNSNQNNQTLTPANSDTTQSPNYIPITDARGIMMTIVDLLRSNNGSKDEELTPLITNLSKLMKSLGNAATGVRGMVEKARARRKKNQQLDKAQEKLQNESAERKPGR